MCVAFLVQEDKNGKATPQGTAFFVRVAIEGWNHFDTYLVTAKHNLECKDHWKPLFVRYNSNLREMRDLELSEEGWLRHETQDVAALRVKVPLDMSAACVPHYMLVTLEELYKNPPEPGTPVFIATLFKNFHGQKSIQPIFRFGNLSLVPEPGEQMMCHRPGLKDAPMDVCLVESLSFGGSSGSPVFLANNAAPRIRETHNAMKLLGLVHGHFDASRDVKLDKDSTISVPNNAGITVVMPAQGILDLILRDDQEERRAELREHLIKTNGKLPESEERG